MKLNEFMAKFKPIWPYFYGCYFTFFSLSFVSPMILFPIYYVVFSKVLFHWIGFYSVFLTLFLFIIAVLYGRYLPYFFQEFEVKDATKKVLSFSIGGWLGAHFFRWSEGMNFSLSGGYIPVVIIFIGCYIGSRMINESIIESAKKFYYKAQIRRQSQYFPNPELDVNYFKKVLLVLSILLMPFLVIVILGYFI